MINPADGSQAGLVLSPRRIASEWEGSVYLIPVSAFPAPLPELAELQFILDGLAALVRERHREFEHMFIQLASLHKGDAAARFSANAEKWMPRMGLGVFPDRRPPCNWTREDFTELGPNERPRCLMSQVFEISKSDEARSAARQIMVGLGTLVEVFTIDDSTALLRKGKELLLPAITDRSFRSFPYYLPLFDAASFQRGGKDIDRWLCGASVYIRESLEDSGVLIASRESLDEWFANVCQHLRAHVV